MVAVPTILIGVGAAAPVLLPEVVVATAAAAAVSPAVVWRSLHAELLWVGLPPRRRCCCRRLPGPSISMYVHEHVSLYLLAS